jgi:hypothetical protein
MRSLGNFSTASDASMFGQILSSNAIQHRVDPEKDGTYSIRIADDRQFSTADALLEKYLAETRRGPSRNPAPPFHLRLAAAPLTTVFIAISVIVTLLLWYGPEQISDYFFLNPILSWRVKCGGPSRLFFCISRYFTSCLTCSGFSILAG